MPSPRPLSRLVLSAGLVLAIAFYFLAPEGSRWSLDDLLAACGGKTAIDGLQTIAGIYEDFVDGSAGAVGFSLLTGQIQNDPGLVIPWELELNGQPAAFLGYSNTFPDSYWARRGRPGRPPRPRPACPCSGGRARPG